MRDRFRFTKVHVNTIILAFVLTVIQAIILYDLNGGTVQFLMTAPVERIAIVFSPTIGIVATMKMFAGKPDDPEE